MSKNVDKVRFTGGDNFTGLLKIYHDVIMKNELHDGKGAYKLSHAGGESGPSFGGNQMDIAGNEDARKALADIIINAQGKVAELSLSASDIDSIKKKLLPTSKSPQELATKLETLKGSSGKV